MPFILRGRFTPRPYDSKTVPTMRARRFQNVLVLVDDHFDKLVAGGAKVLPRVEFGRFLREDLADHGRHDEPSVGVDIDLAHGRLRRSAKLLGGNADRGVEFSAVWIDDVDVLGNDRA